MKKIALLSLIASTLLLAACAKDNTCQPQPQPAPAPVHHDYKGECNK
jgi:uncharacterized lipoprotein YajG